MQDTLLPFLRCPVTRREFTIDIKKKSKKILDAAETTVIEEAVLFTQDGWFYPVIKGIPRLNVEAIYDYADFLRSVLPDYAARCTALQQNFAPLLKLVQKKNRRTKASFALEWGVYDYGNDKTWGADADGMLKRFLEETAETVESLQGKMIFDAGCGNGFLNVLLAQNGIANIAMDFSSSIEMAYQKNNNSLVHFIQGDVQFPPVEFDHFDIVHSSGVLIATNNTELSFSCLVPLVKQGGKLSVWLYHPRKDFIHNLFNRIRKLSSRLPLRFQYYLYKFTIFPVAYIVKRAKGNQENSREMMVNILDWFTPEFRWEHDHEEACSWFYKRNFTDVKITTNEMFGFNITGQRK